jgi:hypothetical protein
MPTPSAILPGNPAGTIMAATGAGSIILPMPETMKITASKMRPISAAIIDMALSPKFVGGNVREAVWLPRASAG